MYEYLTYSELRNENQEFFDEIVRHVSMAPTTVVVHNDPDNQRVRFLTRPEQPELPLGNITITNSSFTTLSGSTFSGLIIDDVVPYDPN